MKVLLINPKSGIEKPMMPLGIGYLAAFLLKNNIDVDIIDASAEDISYEKLVNKTLEIKPDLVGISMLTPTFQSSKKTIEMIKEKLPDVKIVVGGPHASALPQEVMNEIPEIDFLVCKEGEHTSLELVNAIKNNGDLSKIKGLVYRDKGKIMQNPPRAVIEDLDTIPFPAREKFPMHLYKTHPPYGRKNPIVNIITSRGCPYSCAYCSKSVFGKRLRMVSPKRVVDEMELVIKKYNAKEIRFYDDDFTLDMDRAEKICDEMLDRKIKILWSCTTRVDLVNENLLRKMKKAGCWLISYGVESSNQKFLDEIGKGITIEQIRKAFKLTKEIGIKTLAFFMLGLPGETKETIEDNIKFSIELDPDFVNWSLTTIFPDTPLVNIIKEHMKKKGRIVPYTQKGKEVYRLDWNKEPLYVYEENFTIDELQDYIRQAYKRFYFRPKYILKQLFKMKSPSELIYYTRAGLGLLRSV